MLKAKNILQLILSNHQVLLQTMQCISSQTTGGICIFASRKWNHPILTEIELPEHLRTSLASTRYNGDCLYLQVSPSFFFFLTIQLDSQARCICSSGKWWKSQHPSTVFFCACRSAEPCLFSSASVFSKKQSSQGYKGLRISSFIADLLPTVTSNWHFTMSVTHLELSNPSSHPNFHFFNLNVILQCFVTSSNLSG